MVAAGGVEQNGLLANSQGAPQWGHVIGLKTGICGATLLFEETHWVPVGDRAWIGINAATAGVYTLIGVHNLNLADSLPKTTP